MWNIPGFNWQHGLEDWYAIQAQNKYDQAFVRQWELNCNQINPASTLKIFEFKQVHHEARALLVELKTTTNKNNSEINDDPKPEQAQRKPREIQKRLDEIFERLSPNALSLLKLKIQKRKRKRRYQKRLRQKLPLLIAQTLSEREALSAKIDAEREALRQNSLLKQQELDGQRKTAEILSHVTKEKADITRLRKTLDSLQTLRNLRKKSVLPASSSVTASIESSAESLKRLLAARMATCDEQEAALRSSLPKTSELSDSVQEDSLVVKISVLKEHLFGPDTLNESIEPYFRRFYSTAEASLENLIKIRQEWDRFLTSPNDPTPLASSIPLKWVPPPPDPQS